MSNNNGALLRKIAVFVMSALLVIAAALPCAVFGTDNRDPEERLPIFCLLAHIPMSGIRYHLRWQE